MDIWASPAQRLHPDSCLTIDVAALWIPYVRKGLAKLATECLLRGKAKVRSNILTDKHFQFSPLEDEMCCQKNVTDNPSADVKNCSELSVFCASWNVESFTSHIAVPRLAQRRIGRGMARTQRIGRYFDGVRRPDWGRRELCSIGRFL